MFLVVEIKYNDCLEVLCTTTEAEKQLRNCAKCGMKSDISFSHLRGFCSFYLPCIATASAPVPSLQKQKGYFNPGGVTSVAVSLQNNVLTGIHGPRLCQLVN